MAQVTDPHEDHRIKVWGPYGYLRGFAVVCETCRLAGRWNAEWVWPE